MSRALLKGGFFSFYDNTRGQQQTLGLTVTDFRVMPWKVPMVSILKLSVSKEEKQNKTQQQTMKLQVTGCLLRVHNQKQNIQIPKL